MPAARQRSRSPFIAWAVIATIGTRARRSAALALANRGASPRSRPSRASGRPSARGRTARAASAASACAPVLRRPPRGGRARSSRRTATFWLTALSSATSTRSVRPRGASRRSAPARRVGPRLERRRGCGRAGPTASTGLIRYAETPSAERARSSPGRGARGQHQQPRAGEAAVAAGSARRARSRRAPACSRRAARARTAARAPPLARAARAPSRAPLASVGRIRQLDEHLLEDAPVVGVVVDHQHAQAAQSRWRAASGAASARAPRGSAR